MMRNFNFQIRQISTCLINNNKQQNHYESLGLSKNATQADIKSAYYKLSMQYHPDKHSAEGKDGDAAKKFRDITEAYKVLSNVNSRRLYDKGLTLHQPLGATAATAGQRQSTWSFTPASRSNVYNFDEWSKAHYETTFARDMRNRERRRQEQHMREINIGDQKSERVIIGMSLLVFAILVALYGREDADRIRGHNVNFDIMLAARDKRKIQESNNSETKDGLKNQNTQTDSEQLNQT